VKVFGREHDSSQNFRAENEELYDAAFKAQFLSASSCPP
jgi:ATP-binding cassette subfamily B protein